MSETDESIEVPEALISIARMSGGWSIIWYNKYECPFLQDSDLKRISSKYSILHVLVDEHCMASSSEMWENGRSKWRISHNGENGPEGLSVLGVPPAGLAAIQSEYEKMQEAAGGTEADVDYIFEIPLVQAKIITGFKHDEESSTQVGSFKVLKYSRERKSFWARVFG